MKFEPKSARDAARICGLKSVAMLDYLERTEVFARSGHKDGGRGRYRRYNFRDLMVLKVLASLLKNGASVAALKDALRQFQNEKWQADVASLGHGEKKIRYLIVSGKQIMFATSRDNFFDLTNSGQWLSISCLTWISFILSCAPQFHNVSLSS